MSLQVGKYKAKAIGVDFGNSPKTGTEFIAIAFEVGPAREIETWNGYLSEKAAPRTIQALRAMGWAGNDLSTIEPDASNLPGWVQVDVQDDVAQDGTVRGTRIAFVNSLSGMVGTPMTENNRKSLALRLRALVAAAPIVAPVIEAPEPTTAPKPMRRPGEDDDLPFG